MKKISLYILATIFLTSSLNAIILYTDKSTGQIFTTMGKNRIKLGNFTSSKVELDSHSSKLKFSGTHYLGFLSNKETNKMISNNFEMRRNYLQVKAYVLDDPKSYLRMTLDQTNSNGDNTMRIKYAYLYVDKILPDTGMEFGQVHRPWLDYEEHQSWWFRSVDKTFIESKQSADLTNSADMGITFKTNKPFFTSEIGLFNGEGYHDKDNGRGLSFEWRTTVAINGNGNIKRKPKKMNYFDLSFWGQENKKNAKNNNRDYRILGLHTVYNNPNFLIALNYVKAENENKYIIEKTRVHHNGEGYSINTEYRFGHNLKYTAFARYDNWTAKDTINNKPEYNIKHSLYGIAWEQNKNFTWILNGKTFNPEDGKNYKANSKTKANSIMLTAQVEW